MPGQSGGWAARVRCPDAAAAVRAVMESVGIADITVKCLGSRNPHNLTRATIDALLKLRGFEEVARSRGKEVEHIRF